MKRNIKQKKAAPFLSGQKGFTLIEVIVALAVVTIGIVVVNAMQITATRGNFTASNITTASNWAADQIEQLFVTPYADVTDTNGNGDKQAQDLLPVNADGSLGNGIDDDDEGTFRDGILNFGLDEDTPATADGSTTSNDTNQKYTIMWNVADNYPMPNTKTLQVIVTWNEGGTTKSVSLQHKKTNFF